MIGSQFWSPFVFGDEVHFRGDKSIKALVIGFAFYKKNPTVVQVCWFANGDYKEAWVSEDLLTREK